MKLFHSIRAKLTLYYALILAVTLIGFGVTSFIVTRSAMFNSLDYSLRNEVKWVNEFIAPQAKKIRLKRAAVKELQELKRTHTVKEKGRHTLEPDTADHDREVMDEMWNQIYHHTLLSPRRHYIQILDRNGDLLFRSQSLRGHSIEYSDLPYQWINVVNANGFDGEHLRLALIQNDYVKIFVAYPLEPINEELYNLFYNIVLIMPFAMIISILGSWFLAGRSLKPVDELTKAAREITAQNLSRRLPPSEIDDELGRLTQQFNDMIQRLQESFTQVQRFSADASHELRTPLTIMRGEIEIALRNSRMSKSTRELISSIYDELVRLSTIVESLMMLIKSDTGRMVITREPLRLDELIEELYDDMKMIAKAKHIELKMESTVPVSIIGDALRLKQLFMNLVDNALKYTQPHGNVDILLNKEEKSAVVSIRDNGIGISHANKEKIFDRFYRVPNNGGVEDAGGSGLGLSIAKWIVEAHRGTIEVQSREGKGSAFIVRLPLGG
jgi:heavy metal sensor kinase